MLSEGCVLSGGRWALHGMVRRYLSAVARLVEIKIPLLDIISLIEGLPHDNNTNSYQVHLGLQDEDHCVKHTMANLFNHVSIMRGTVLC